MTTHTTKATEEMQELISVQMRERQAELNLYYNMRNAGRVPPGHTADDLDDVIELLEAFQSMDEQRLESLAIDV